MKEIEKKWADVEIRARGLILDIFQHLDELEKKLKIIEKNGSFQEHVISSELLKMLKYIESIIIECAKEWGFGEIENEI